MTNSNIITNQFVRINQTPASIGERVLARILDTIFISFGFTGIYLLFDGLMGTMDETRWLIFLFFMLVIFVWMYDFWWETFNNGQTPGKYIMKIRVINKNGSRPTMGSFFMRWLLSTIDVGCGGIGMLFILLTKNSQRLGDLAAGTMVIKLTDIRKIHISLDEFYYAKKDYHPVYEEAKNLSQAQVAVIEKALYSSNDNHESQIETLADKVAKFLKVQPKENSKEKFLATILHDYNYYLMELV